MRLVLVEPPTVEPLTAAEAKARLNIGDEVSDEVMDALITAARQTIDGADGWLGRALITQVWRGTLDQFPCWELNIPHPPLQSVLAINYIDGTGAQIEHPDSNYQIVPARRPYITPAFGKAWPATRCQSDAVSIDFVVGYGQPTDVPEPIRSAIALMASNIRSLSARNLFVSATATEGVGSTQYVVSPNAAQAIDTTVSALLSPFRIFA
jgi:uncharacterized phiE125 gp8 family phage protein